MNRVKSLAVLSAVTFCASAALAMGSAPSDEDIFKGTGETMKPTQTITSLVKITKVNENVYPKVSKSGEVIFQSISPDKDKKTDDSGNPVNPGSFNLFITNGYSFRTVTNDKSNNENPSFINNSKVIFNSDRLGGEKIWIGEASGKGGIIQLTSGALSDLMPDVSPDGQKVIYCSFSKPYTQPLSLVDYGARWKVFAAWGEIPSIWMVNIDGRNLTQFYEGIRPTWSPDGKRIAFYKPTGKNYQIWLMDTDGSNQTQITNGDYNCIEPAWTPDGRLVFASNQAGNYDIWSIKSDGTELTQLTVQDCYDGAPACSPDGKYVYFHSFLGGSWNIWRMELAQPFIVTPPPTPETVAAPEPEPEVVVEETSAPAKPAAKPKPKPKTNKGR
jgi:Tol biopolymer transport system component